MSSQIMPEPFTFGVELEFCLEHLREGQAIPPAETKIVMFPVLEDESNYHPRFAAQERVIRHISQTIADEGSFSIDPMHPRRSNFNQWEVTYDISIKSPYTQHAIGSEDSGNEADSEGTNSEYSEAPSKLSRTASEIEQDRAGDPYTYQGIEVVSPALHFCDESLREVEKMCALLMNTYRISNNRTTGLHVHLGHGPNGYKLTDLKSIMAFLYTFEPQISSLHPKHRFNNGYSQSLRWNSRGTLNLQEKYNRLPHASDFALSILGCKTRKMCVKLGSPRGFGRYSHYNIQGESEDKLQMDMRDTKRTIEFRQHNGTMDGEEITMWVRTLVGILTFVESGNPLALTDLMAYAWRAEKWEKVEDESENQRTKEIGSTFADEEFTIIDLCEYLGLAEQAAYYKDRWHKHKTKRKPAKLGSDTKWTSKKILKTGGEADKLNKMLINRGERKAGLQETSFDFSTFPAYRISNDPKFDSDNEADSHDEGM
jgi:hypothetical protein